MKRLSILLLILSASLTLGFAQDVKLFYQGNELGDTLLIPNIDPAPNADDYELTIGVKNNTEDEISVLIVKKNISILPGSYNSFCLDVCYGENVDTARRMLVLGAGQTSDFLQFHILYNARGNVGVSIVKYMFFVENVLADSVFVKFSSEGVGISEMPIRVNSFAAYPNPANGQVTVQYDLSNYRFEAKAHIVLTNLIGSKIMSVPVSAAKGKSVLDISNLGSGIYFYSLEVDNKIVSTKKLVVK